jgi:hypothetical protein
LPMFYFEKVDHDDASVDEDRFHWQRAAARR